LYRPDRYALRMEMMRTVQAGVRRWATVLPTAADRKRKAKMSKTTKTTRMTRKAS
jgi:hypothetical protein